MGDYDNCICGSPEKKCGGTIITKGPKEYLDKMICDACGDRYPFNYHDEGIKCEKCDSGRYKKTYRINRKTVCDRCGDFSYLDERKGEKCTVSVCAISGDNTYSCREYDKMLKSRAKYEGE